MELVHADHTVPAGGFGDGQHLALSEGHGGDIQTRTQNVGARSRGDMAGFTNGTVALGANGGEMMEEEED